MAEEDVVVGTLTVTFYEHRVHVHASVDREGVDDTDIDLNTAHKLVLRDFFYAIRPGRTS